MPHLAEVSWVCPGCGAARQPGSVFVWGPYPLTPEYGPLYWDPRCLRIHVGVTDDPAWLNEEVVYRPKA